MSTYSIVVLNTAPGCGNEIEQELTVTSCTSFIVKLSPTSSAIGPFNVLVDGEVYYVNQTREQMIIGVVLNLMCETAEILIFTQDGFQLVTQDNNPLILQQETNSYLVSSGNVSCPINGAPIEQIIYSASKEWESVVRFYSDVDLTIPFNGGGLYYTNSGLGCGDCWVINNNGYTSNFTNPC